MLARNPFSSASFHAKHANAQQIDSGFRTGARAVKALLLFVLLAGLLQNVFAQASAVTNVAATPIRFTVQPGGEVARRSLRLAPFRVLNSVDGLPQNTIYAMAEASDGRIYLGTQDGLSRYDGRNFERIPLTSPEQAVAVNALRVENGQLWVGTDEDGLWRSVGDEWEKLRSDSEAIVTVREIRTRSNGGVWVATDSGVWVCQQRCRLVFADPKQRSISDVLEGHHDGAPMLWVAVEDRGVLAIPRGANDELGTIQFELGREHGLANLFTRSLAQWQGALWIGSGRGLARVHGTSITSWRFDGPFGFGVFDLLVQKGPEGAEHLLAATYGGGVVRIDSKLNTEVIDVAGGLPENHIYCLMQQTSAAPGAMPGPVWIGTSSSGIAREESTAWMAYTERHGLPHQSVIGVGRARFPDGQTSPWIGTISGSVRQLEGRWRPFLPEPIAQRPLYDLAEDGRGGLWLATDRGLYRWRGGQPENISAGTTEIVGIAVLDLERQGTDGPLWLTTRHGISIIDGEEISALPSIRDGARSLHYSHTLSGGAMVTVGDQVHWFDAQNKSHQLPASCLVHREAFSAATYTQAAPGADPEIWFGGRAGLTRVRFAASGVQCSPYPAPLMASNWVFQVAFDQLGNLYAFGYKGVQRLALSEFYANPRFNQDDLSKIPTQQFDRVDGLPDLEFNRGAMLDPDGVLWAANVGGAVLFDPQLGQHHSWRSPLIFSQARAGRIDLQDGAVLPFRSEINFEYRLLSFSREARIAYQSQLVGLDAGRSAWSAEAGRSFARLPGGAYRFKVWARDANGREFGPIEQSFSVRKPWWLNPWLLLAEGLALVFLGGAMGKWRAGHQRRKALADSNRLERQVQARTQELNQANSRLEILALTDALTGCYNRRCLYERYESMCAQQAWLAVLIDVDFFKRINDQHGHAVGDEVLRQVAERLRAQGTPVFRMGGEEFLLLEPISLQDSALTSGGLPLSVQRHAEQCLRLWLNAIASTQIVVAANSLSVSASMGAFFLPHSLAAGLNFEQALSLADQALYLAKEGGRNRACLITAFAATDSPHVVAKIAAKEIVLPS